MKRELAVRINAFAWGMLAGVALVELVREIIELGEIATEPEDVGDAR